MGLLRQIFRIFFPRVRPRATYDYARPSNMEGQAQTTLVSSQVTRRTLVSVAVVANATLSGPCWVIDGDTIDIGGKRIRLSGIDAPELDHPYGKSAKGALITLCKGMKITAVFDGEVSYERGVATCYLPDGRDLSAEMVKLGMAIDWAKYSGGKYRSLEEPGLRRKLWRCDARQKGRMPSSSMSPG